MSLPDLGESGVGAAAAHAFDARGATVAIVDCSKETLRALVYQLHRVGYSSTFKCPSSAQTVRFLRSQSACQLAMLGVLCLLRPSLLELSIDLIRDSSINRHVILILQGHGIVGDFSSSEGISAALAAAAHWLGGIDILILNVR